MDPSFTPVELSVPLPKHPHLNLHAHLSFLGNCAMAHLTTTDIAESQNSSPPLGSFVYAMPDVREIVHPSNTELIRRRDRTDLM